MKILLVCAAGMSTSMLLKKMEKYATDNNIDVAIDAISETKLEENLENVNVILLAPQVRFSKARVESIASPKGIPVEVINTIEYGTMNGEKVLNQALNAIKK